MIIGGIRRARLAGTISLQKIMDDRRQMIRGFAEIDDGEYSVSGGINPETIRKIAKIIGILIDVIASYGEDFYKGYKKALEGKPLYAFAS